MCKTNKDFANICSDDHFWKKRLERDFKQVYISYREQYEFQVSSNKKLYLFLSKFTNFDKLNYIEQMRENK